jgi:O-antigen ligase
VAASLPDATAGGRGFVLASLVGTVCLGLVLVASRDPAVALAALAVSLVLAVACFRVEAALLLLVATTPLEAAIDLGGALSITKLAGGLCFASFAFNAIATRRVVRLDRSHAVVFAILAIALVSTLGAEDIGMALSTTVRYASYAGLYVVVTQFAGDHHALRRIAWVLSISSAIAGFLAIQGFLSGQFVLARLPYGDPNDLAYILATTLPLTFWLLRPTRPSRRPLLLLLIAIIGTAVLLSFSRGALVGLMAGLAWHAVTERRHLLVLLAGGAVTLVGMAVFVNANRSQVEVGLQQKQSIAAYNVESRLDAWTAAAKLATDRPVLGIGPGNFGLKYTEATGRPEGSIGMAVVHNAYLDVAAEVGVLALVLFVTYLAMAFLRLTSARRHATGPPGLAAALRTALVIAVVSAVTLSEQYYAPFWLLGGMATAVWWERQPSPASPSEDHEG